MSLNRRMTNGLKASDLEFDDGISTARTQRVILASDGILSTTSQNIEIPKIGNIGFQYAFGKGYEADGYTFRTVEIIGETDQVTLTKTQQVELLLPGEALFEVPINTSVNVQIASTSVNDTALGVGARVITIIGFDGAHNQIIEDITMNGQTPVTSVNQFNYIFFSTVKESGTQGFTGNPNNGDIYITDNVTTFTLGVPDDRTKIMATMGTGLGSGFTGQFKVPPSTQLFINQLVLSSAVNSNQDSIIVVTFNVKTINTDGSSSGWKQGARLLTTSQTPTVGLIQDSFPDINFSSSPNATTFLRLGVRRIGGNTDDILQTTYATATFVAPTPP